jgi:CRISPR system Cascade subunit CasB
VTSATPADPLVGYLLDLVRRNDRRSLAMLRRSLAPGCEASAYPVVARFFPPERRPSLERAMLLLAGLFATHPEHSSSNLGLALRRLADKKGSGSIEGRFMALLDARNEDIAPHLRQLVSLLASEGLAIDWHDLLRALKNWDFEDNCARRQWAKDFWGSRDSFEQETKDEK